MPTQFKSPIGTGPITGIIDFTDGMLTIEYEKPRFLKKSQIEQIVISATEIDSLEFQNTRPRAKLNLRALYLDTLSRIPWAKQLEVTFSIPAKEANRAYELEKNFAEYLRSNHS